jgi:hypothetical protein
MKGKNFALVLILIGFSLFVSACGVILASFFYPASERKILFPIQVVQITSDTTNGSLLIPFNVTEEGWVYADVTPDPHGNGFATYSYHFSTSQNEQSIQEPAMLKTGAYYLVMPFTLHQVQGLDLDPPNVWIGIYERIVRPIPYLTLTVSFLTGSILTLMLGYVFLNATMKTRPLEHQKGSWSRSGHLGLVSVGVKFYLKPKFYRFPLSVLTSERSEQ